MNNLLNDSIDDFERIEGPPRPIVRTNRLLSKMLIVINDLSVGQGIRISNEDKESHDKAQRNVIAKFAKLKKLNHNFKAVTRTHVENDIYYLEITRIS